MNEIQFPHNSVQLFDSAGRMTKDGHRFFLALWERTGAGSGSLDSSVLNGLLSGDTDEFLRADGVSAVPAYPSGAAPSASVGTVAAPGVATTFMRSDAAPAINLSIAPTWTGAHAFSAGLTGTTAAMTGAVSGDSLTAVNGFGCNSKTAQTEVTVNAAVTGTAGATYTATEQALINDLKALLNQIRGALVANGVCV